MCSTGSSHRLRYAHRFIPVRQRHLDTAGPWLQHHLDELVIAVLLDPDATRNRSVHGDLREELLEGVGADLPRDVHGHHAVDRLAANSLWGTEASQQTGESGVRVQYRRRVVMDEVFGPAHVLPFAWGVAVELPVQ